MQEKLLVGHGVYNRLKEIIRLISCQWASRAT
jgi:hypothetical protein